MILTCPACGTQYVVKDGAIPPAGRKVRCASCKHSWHQDPQPAEPEPAAVAADEETIAEFALIEPRSGPELEERAFEAAALAADNPAQETVAEERADGTSVYVEPGLAEDAADPPGYSAIDPEAQPEQWVPAPQELKAGLYAREDATADRPAEHHEWAAEEHGRDDVFSPFILREPEHRKRSPLVLILIVALLIAAIAAAFWFLAPAPWKDRIGIAGVGDTPLQLMMTHSDRQKLASGNELLAVSGRVINPTDENQTVPPIQAQLRDRAGKLVYSWTIAPPARVLPPRASATFNSAELKVPPGGDELTITLGSAKT
jgi:predicted Zn finger-like uncharacterized protein